LPTNLVSTLKSCCSVFDITNEEKLPVSISIGSLVGCCFFNVEKTALVASCFQIIYELA